MHHAEFSIHAPADGSLRLDRAVLLYRGASGAALATVHDVLDVDGEAVIGAGQAMTVRSAIALSRSLRQHVAHGGFLPETVLYLDGDLLMWWLPPMRRHVALRVDDAHAAQMGGAGRGAVVPHPGLVFAASSRVWRVWAVQGRTRPTPASPLFQAPYFNVDAQGQICQGSVPTPQGTTVDRIGAWNAAFFHSYFTHPNRPGQLMRYPGGAYAFWRAMLDGRFARFPARVLVPTDTTLGGLLGLPEAA